MADIALFDDTLYRVEPATELSADRRRTRRQQEALASQIHPLGVALNRNLRLHPDAPDVNDRHAAGPRCGSCWHRRVLDYRNRPYGKCLADDGSRVSHGAGTDVRAWWPACRDYSPGDPSLSPDAARCVPEAVS